MDDFTAKDFTIENTQFFIAPMSAMEGFALMEEIRRELGNALDITGMRSTMEMEATEDGSATAMAIANGAIAFARTLMRMDPVFVERIRGKLFARITFRNANASAPQPLQGFEDLAFTSPYVIYELIARSLAVNFMTGIPASVSSILEALKGLIPSAPSAPTPPSPPWSMPDSPPGVTAEIT